MTRRTRNFYFTETKMPIFEIDPDIRKAETLASHFYTSAEYFELSKEKIFSRTWQLAGQIERNGRPDAGECAARIS